MIRVEIAHFAQLLPWNFGGRTSRAIRSGSTPDLTDEANQHSLVQLFADPSPEQELDYEQRVCRNSQQIGLERIKTQRLASESDVRCFWGHGDRPCETDQVYGPHVVVGQGIPKSTEREALPVVHGTLSWVVEQNPCNKNELLPLCEPAFLGSQCTFNYRFA